MQEDGRAPVVTLSTAMRDERVRRPWAVLIASRCVSISCCEPTVAAMAVRPTGSPNFCQHRGDPMMTRAGIPSGSTCAPCAAVERGVPVLGCASRPAFLVFSFSTCWVDISGGEEGQPERPRQGGADEGT